MAGFSLNAEGKKINLLGNLGLAVSDLEGLFVDLGAEMQLTENIYGQFVFDYYLSPGSMSGEDMSAVDYDDSFYGFNLNAVYKHQLQDTLKLFALGGLHYSFFKFSASYFGMNFDISDSYFGIGLGGGVEYSLSEDIALVGGATYKLIFQEGGGNWLKLYGGINYTISK
jgi:opacity protein-like surface antigen